MTQRPLPDNERLLQLLADQATEGLSDAGLRELRELMAPYPDLDPEGLDSAAAAVDMGFSMNEMEDLPKEIESRVMADAEAFFARTQRGPQADDSGDASRGSGASSPVAYRWSGLQKAGWVVAAASIFIALIGWIPRGGSVPVPPVEPTPFELRQALLDSPGVIQVAWATPSDNRFKNVTGDVVWNSGRQEGYMRLAGMPVNDRSKEQYQLWIVDPSRDEKHPVDGGVFDISADGEAVVPIAAKLDIVKPTVFAITLEQPGGVVVSKGPLLVVAPVEG